MLPIFFGKRFGVVRFTTLVLKQGKMLPDFLGKHFGVIRFQACLSQTTEKCCPFFSEKNLGWFDLRLLFSNRGKCCPIFSEKILASFDFRHVCHRPRKMLPIFFGKIFGVIRFQTLIKSGRGKMLPDFLRKNFGGYSTYELTGLKQGKMLPVFFKEFRWFDFRHFWSGAGENAARFSRKKLGFFDLWLFGLKQVKMLPFFSKIIWRDSTSSQGRMLPIFLGKGFGVIRVQTSLVSSRGKCCPLFSEKF